jgi:hypothetical protein
MTFCFNFLILQDKTVCRFFSHTFSICGQLDSSQARVVIGKKKHHFWKTVQRSNQNMLLVRVSIRANRESARGERQTVDVFWVGQNSKRQKIDILDLLRIKIKIFCWDKCDFDVNSSKI